MQESLEKLKYNDAGLIPTIVQEFSTKEVLMMAWMNKVSLEKTLASGETWFFSRSRQKLWHKGETSGHVQKVKELYYDCDGDTLLVFVEQEGAACHEGYKSCFHYRINADSSVTITGEKKFNPDQIYGEKKEMNSSIIEELYKVILQRQEERPAGAYTTYLFDQGIDKICKKIGEESAEVIIGAKNGSKQEVVYESADLIYHLLVLLAEQGVTPGDVFQELASRRK